MKKICLILLLCLIFLGFSRAQSNIYSFENGSIPGGFLCNLGQLEVNSQQFKLGGKSLCWSWIGGDVLKVVNPLNLANASLLSGGGVTTWIYNDTPSDGKLVFEFKNALGVVKCESVFKLNYKGWRCFWIGFYQDLNHDRSELTQIDVVAPAGGNGKIYLDCFEVTSSVPWERMSDFQYSVNQGNISLDDFLQSRLTPDPLALTQVSPDEVDGIDVVTTRLDNWYQGEGLFPSSPEYQSRLNAVNRWVSRGVAAYPDLGLTHSADGTVQGEGLFPQFTPALIDNTPTLRFRDVSEKYLIQLALDYRLNNRTESLNNLIMIQDWYHNQGWADGSALGTLYMEKLRSSGYFHSLFIARNGFSSQQLSRELKTLRWFSLFGDCMMDFENPGDNADNVRTLAMAKLFYALMQQEPGKQAASLYEVKKYFENAFSVTNGYLDVFKPDFSGYHHRGTYFSAYFPDALYAGTFIYYLLHGTPYALSDEVFHVLKQSLLTFRFTAANYSVPNGASGRFPNQESVLEDILPAYAYLALSLPEPDKELVAAFKRLWRPLEDPLKSLIAKSSADIAFKTTLGEVELMLRANNVADAAEQPLRGSLFLPFSGLFITRQADWHLSVKGFSKYIWDYESSGTENVFGRYLSYGQVEFRSLNDSRRSLVFGNPAYDWNRIPGTTTKHVSNNALDFNNGGAGRHRNFSDQPFLGGVVLSDQASMVSMILHDNTFDNTLYSRKSVFAFDNCLLCLGSGISNSRGTNNQTETTLFQNELVDGDEVMVNDQVVSVSQTGFQKPLIRDNFGNFFLVQNGTVDLVKSGSLMTAYINHGKAPVDASYAYCHLIKPDANMLEQYRGLSSNPLQIVRQDKQAHVVLNKATQTLGAALFEAGEHTNAGLILRVNSPSVVMYQLIGDNQLHMVLSDPDMRRPSAANIDKLTPSQVKAIGQEFNYEMEVAGSWQGVGGDDGVSVVVTERGTTLIKVVVKDGKSYRVGLEKLATSLPTPPQNVAGFRCLKVNSNQYRISSSSERPFNLSVLSVSGSSLTHADGVVDNRVVDLESFVKGVYLIKVFGGSEAKCFKVDVY
ncbi:MAG: hypothetical protein KBH01_00575 [Breznakibacter sp.]|nr:hypothetical protein [Breznakibacter sp.]